MSHQIVTRKKLNGFNKIVNMDQGCEGNMQQYHRQSKQTEKKILLS